MADVTITKINDTHMKVVCKEVATELDIQNEFSFEVPNAQFDPRVKAGKWDGIKKLYNRANKRMYTGLILYLLEFLEKYKFTYDVDPELFPGEDMLEDEDVINLIDGIIQPKTKDGQLITPYDYQINAIKHMLNMSRSTSLLATSAGKSLVIYVLARIYQLMDEMTGKRIFITVPSVMLVEQLYSDFKEYATGSDWRIDHHVQRVTAKHPKELNRQIIITTWQSMQKMPLWMFEDSGAIIVDECHTASADVLTKLIESATACPFRHGLTGTLDGAASNEMVIQGLLGPKQRFVTAREIIDQGRATDININVVTIDHGAESSKRLYEAKSKIADHRARYQTEIEFINSDPDRLNLLLGMVDSVPGNSIVLFDRVDGYGKILYEEYCKRYDNPAFLIVGEVDSNERDQIRQNMEDQTNARLFGTFQILQQGVSIKNLHNAFFVSSSKSQIRALQSIGRLMRLHESKDKGQIFDIVDKLVWDGQANSVYKHIDERLKYYIREQFKVEFIDLKLNQ